MPNRLLTVIPMAIATILTLTIPVFSQTTVQNNWQVSLKVQLPPTTNRGAPPRTSGTGSRGHICGDQLVTTPENQTYLTALMPKNNLATTTVPNPSVYIYIPEAINKNAQFRVIDLETETVVYGTDKTFPLPNSPGIIKINLPQTVELKPTNIYQWQLLIICNLNNRAADEMIEGWLERSALTPVQQAKIEQAAPQSVEQAIIYAEAGIWTQTIDILAHLRDQNPQAKVEWTELLESEDLGDIAKSQIFDIP